jgi:hypothetical protein
MKNLLLAFVMILTLGVVKGISQPIDSTTLNAASITGTVTLDQNTIYLIKGFNEIKTGGALVIPEGTLLKGDKITTGTIIVHRGGILYANGTAQRPIVFTSNQAPGQRAPGDWGGIVMLGRSGINTSTGADSAKIEGFPAGFDYYYGGQPIVNNDSSGCLRYVRLEYPGVNLTAQPGNEINGLTMGGVGSRTVIEYVQVSYCGDDAYEWFGGTVNPRYLVAIGTIDDDFDCDNGFRGNVQFGLAVRDSNGYSDVSNSHFFEIDNNNNSPSNFNGPRTKPVFSNMTCIGPNTTTDPQFARGLHIRRNSQPSIFNSVMGGYGKLFYFDGSGVYNAASGDTIRMRFNLYSYINKLADTAGSTSFSPQDWLLTPGWGSSVNNPLSALQLTNPLGFYGASGVDPISNVNWWDPIGGSPALTGANFSDPYLGGFTTTTYRGAFDNSGSNWLLGWSNFNPQNYEPTVGISQISSNVPERFSLSQNYPNPFNPSTKIAFNVPVKGFVTLKVYDALGQEVATLVNQNLSVGEYAYDFNASVLSSGIYFYTLKGENFIETKKMMLVK